MRDELDNKEKQLFLVVTPEVEQKQSWLRDIESYNAAGIVDNLEPEIVNCRVENNDQYVESINK